MSSPNNSPDSPSAAQLAHELANLLDGSLRHLGLAIDTLSHAPRQADADQPAPQDDDNLLARLQTTDRAMRQMATLIRTWMNTAPKPGELFDQSQTLAQVIEQAADIHRATATRHGITITSVVETAAASTPAGPVFPVISNAVLNSIQAIAGPEPRPIDPPRIVISTKLHNNEIYLSIADNGPGLNASMLDEFGQIKIGQTTKPEGHGLGLALSRQIAQHIGGTLELTNQPKGGARLTLRYPLDTTDQTSKTSHSSTPTLFE